MIAMCFASYVMVCRNTYLVCTQRPPKRWSVPSAPHFLGATPTTSLMIFRDTSISSTGLNFPFFCTISSSHMIWWRTLSIFPESKLQRPGNTLYTLQPWMSWGKITFTKFMGNWHWFSSVVIWCLVTAHHDVISACILAVCDARRHTYAWRHTFPYLLDY